MSNFFAALDDSDDEGQGKSATVVTKTKEKKPTKKEVVEPSKVDIRPNKHDDRHTKGGGRSSRPPAREGKRTYDRHSGTGRGREIKKDGGGGRNWGSDKNDAKKAEGPVTEGEEEEIIPIENGDENGKTGVEVEAVEPTETEMKEPEPEEEKTLSYEEYLATKARPESEAFKPLSERKVENEFVGKSTSRKEEEDYLVMGGGKQPRKRNQKKDEKEKLVLDFKVKSVISEERGPRRDGRRDGDRRGGRDGGRGGRDGGRDRGSRGGGRGRNGGRDQAGPSRVDGERGLDATNLDAFPSLF